MVCHVMVVYAVVCYALVYYAILLCDMISLTLLMVSVPFVFDDRLMLSIYIMLMTLCSVLSSCSVSSE